jgi:hypothetical protein
LAVEVAGIPGGVGSGLGAARERKGWVERKRRKIIENMAGIFGNA